MNRHSPGKLQRYLTECSNNSFIHSMIFYTLPFCNFNSVVLIESIRMNKYIVLMKFFDSSKITIYQSTFKILCHHYTRSDLEFEFYRTNIIFFFEIIRLLKLDDSIIYTNCSRNILKFLRIVFIYKIIVRHKVYCLCISIALIKLSHREGMNWKILSYG